MPFSPDDGVEGAEAYEGERSRNGRILAENIAVGRIEARDDREHIVGAAQASIADEVIRKLPRGYDQLIGRC